ncbi:MAG TPA: hypothetical protein VK395_13510 [Gemmataceae bacterium]|nr:hypothetical protein [Gemmataceae bacterium]
MMTIILHLADDVVCQLREKAVESGLTLERYLKQVAQQKLQESNHSRDSVSQLTGEEFDRLLDELASGALVRQLPPDFFRRDA